MKVLVVDDHAYNRELLGYMLEDCGHEPVDAENGELAYKAVEQDQDIALVLMDVMMPVMDGLESTRLIKKSIGNRFLPVLFVTALEDEKNLTSCLEAGGDDFIPKPINENILIAKLNAHVRSKTFYDKLKEAHEELTYHRKMMDREHAIVEHIFKNSDARVTSTSDNIKSYTSPMSMFNGDLVLAAPSPSGGLYGLVGDFTGHGLASSIGSLPVTELFYHNVNCQASVSQIALEINQRLHMLLPRNMFFCAAIFEIDRDGETMTLWMGGMNDILALKETGHQLEQIKSAHMPLGILSAEEFDDSPRVFSIKEYARLFTYTDGVVEAQSANGEEFGEQRLADIIVRREENPIAAIVDAVNDFTAGTEQTDDVSIMEIIPGELVHRSKKTGEIIDVGADYHNAQSIPWRLQIDLYDQDLRQTSVVDQVMSFVSSIQGIELHQDKIFTIVSELYNNSLEHGVLRLDSKLKNTADGFEQYYKLRQQRLEDLCEQKIAIRFNYLTGDPNRLELIIEDTGDGFDVAKLTDEATDKDESHGRGLELLKHLCSSLEYENQGRTVRATYDLCEH